MYRMLYALAAVVLVLGLCIRISPKETNIQKHVDISWPNCREHKFVLNSVGIIGVTGGLDFKPNKCLSNEITWFPPENYSLYMNTNGLNKAVLFKSPLHCSDTQCFAYNYGFNASRYALQYAALQNVHSELWWLDVETENSWSANAVQNRMVLVGMIDAIRKFVIFPRIGIYSTSYQWAKIMGSWKNGLPAWIASGGTSLNDAKPLCDSESFTGGKIWLSQFTPDVDQDYVCDSYGS